MFVDANIGFVLTLVEAANARGSDIECLMHPRIDAVSQPLPLGGRQFICAIGNAIKARRTLVESLGIFADCSIAAIAHVDDDGAHRIIDVG